MSPVEAVKRQFAELLKPRCIKEPLRLFIGRAVRLFEFETAGHHKALALGDTARQVEVHRYIAVNVVKAAALGVLHVDGLLPGHAPVGNVLSGERIGGALHFNHHLSYALTVGRLGHIKAAVGSVQDVLCIGVHPPLDVGE